MYYTNIIKSISARGLFTLLALIMSISLHAQNATVKGVIVDETDTPLIGATVQVKGTATGSITDFDGNYTIKAKKGAVITFSFIGYKTQEIKFTGQSPLNVKMIPDNQTLDEVVVVGYGTMKRSDLTVSASACTAPGPPPGSFPAPDAPRRQIPLHPARRPMTGAGKHPSWRDQTGRHPLRAP